MGLSNEKQTIAPESRIESTLNTLSSNICWMANNKEIANDYKERMIRYILEIDLDLYEPTQYYQKNPHYYYEPSRYEMNLTALCDVNWTDFEYDFDLILRLPLFSASFYNWNLCTQPVNFVAAYLKYFDNCILKKTLYCFDKNAILNVDAIKFIIAHYPHLTFDSAFLDNDNEEVTKILVDHALKNNNNMLKDYLTFAIRASRCDIFDLCSGDVNRISSILSQILSCTDYNTSITDISIFDRIVYFYPDALNGEKVLSNIICKFGNDIETYKKLSMLGKFNEDRIFCYSISGNPCTLKAILLILIDAGFLNAECVDYITNCT